MYLFVAWFAQFSQIFDEYNIFHSKEYLIPQKTQKIYENTQNCKKIFFNDS